MSILAWLLPSQIMSNDPSTGAALIAALLYLPMAFLVINIALLLWLWPDARARGIGKPIGWAVAFLFLGPIALAFYLGMRTPGRLKPCPHCGEEYLAAKEACPHCGWSLADHAIHEDAIGDFTGTAPPLSHA